MVRTGEPAEERCLPLPITASDEKSEIDDRGTLTGGNETEPVGTCPVAGKD